LANELINEPNLAVIKAKVDREVNAVQAALTRGAADLSRQIQEDQKYE